MTQPKTQALAYRIWAYAQPREWNCTMQELADALGESVMRITIACRVKGWCGRVRTATTYAHGVNCVNGSARPFEVAALLQEQVRASSVSQGVLETEE